MKNLIKGLAVDVDGTITDKTRRGCISAIKTIYEMENMGIPVIISTGNILCFTKALSTFLATSGGLVAENGGVIETKAGRTVLGNIENCQIAYEHLKSKLPVEKVQNSDLRISEVAITRKIDVDLIKDVLSDFPVEIYDSKFAIHITDPTINKGTSLIKVAECSGIKPDELLAIGDSENDLELLAAAGIKVAVSNAPEELKNIADYVTKEPYGNGVKEAVEKFIKFN